MKNTLSVLSFLALFAGSCTLNDPNIKPDAKSAPTQEQGSVGVTGGVQLMSISPGLKYYFKGSNNSSIYRSNVSQASCSSFSESINTLGNGASSPHGPAVVYFNGKLYLFHKGETNHYIYVSSSTDGISWSSDVQLGNGAQTIGGISATVFDGSIYICYTSATPQNENIYVSKSSNGTNWTELPPFVTPPISGGNFNHVIPWIFAIDKLYIIHAPNQGSNLRIYKSVDGGNTWNHHAAGPPFGRTSYYKGHSAAWNPSTNEVCLLMTNWLYSGYTPVQVSYSTGSLITWTSPSTFTSTINGQTAQSDQRPVVTWDPSCSRFFAVYRARTSHTILKAYTVNGEMREVGNLSGTTSHGPYVISSN